MIAGAERRLRPLPLECRDEPEDRLRERDLERERDREREPPERERDLEGWERERERELRFDPRDPDRDRRAAILGGGAGKLGSCDQKQPAPNLHEPALRNLQKYLAFSSLDIPELLAREEFEPLREPDPFLDPLLEVDWAGVAERPLRRPWEPLRPPWR